MKDWKASAGQLYDGTFRHMFIGGAWCEARSGDVIEARNPADGSLLATVPRGAGADIDAAVTAARTAFGAGVFSTHLGTAHKLAHRLKAGSVWVNMYHAIDPAVPFGGVKMSGYGREGGTEHLDEYLDTKAIWINTD